jgi:putative membrane protein
VKEPRIRPRFELEDEPVERLEQAAPPVVAEPRVGPGTAGLMGGLALLSTGNFVADQFARASALGWATLGVATAGFGLVGAGVWRELRGLFALREVDDIRADFASGDPDRIVRAARHWLRELPDGAALLPAVNAINDPDAVLALLRTRVGAALQARADALGRNAAVQVFAATAAMPSPALDALLVAWRGTRLVRQVAVLHGLRPGLIGTLGLLRRTAMAAAGVAATDMALDAAARAALSNPLLQHLAGDVAGAGVAARRMVVLTRAASAACSPLPPERRGGG